MGVPGTGGSREGEEGSEGGVQCETGNYVRDGKGC